MVMVKMVTPLAPTGKVEKVTPPSVSETLPVGIAVPELLPTLTVKTAVVPPVEAVCVSELWWRPGRL